MNAEFFDFVHARHIDAFMKAAEKFHCHILVRKTGAASLQYFGRPGYAGKRADMKAKTAVRNSGGYQIQGLVCSPKIHPGACKPGAAVEWSRSAHLITVPPNGFDDDHQPRGVHTPYMLQTNRNHRHYGCVAWVENGMLTPRYVHGDYDLYMLIPAGRPFDPAGLKVRKLEMVSAMDPPASMTLQERLRREDVMKAHAVIDNVGELSAVVGNFLNLEIARKEHVLLGAMMVNHGEQALLGPEQRDFQEVLAVMPEERAGGRVRVLHTRKEHEDFYAAA